MATIECFDASTVQPSDGFTPIPAGRYLAVINDSDMRASAGGQYLQLEFEIIEGDYTGRKLWSRLNLIHTNPDAVKFARADLSAICRAVNVMKLTDTIQLHNLPMVVVVKLKKDKETGEMRNEIRGWEPKGSGVAPAAAAPQAKAPWAK